MSNLNKYLRLFGFGVVGLFFLLGLILLFSDYFNNLSMTYRLILAFLLLGYGAFRLMSTLLKPKKEEENEN